ncbi:MAG: metal-dependent hydrolase [Chloroflexi bacterium]|nr:metal-dependent hydrolase [Chloroflexota bacterium]
MLVFGHAGTALGAAWLLNEVVFFRKPVVDVAGGDKPSSRWWPFARLGARLDIRLLLLASLLPDILDKPLGYILFPDAFGSGWLYGHTLLFPALFGVAGVVLYLKRRSVWSFTVAFGALIHLITDRVWLSPTVLWWPILGWGFPRGNPTGWVARYLRDLLSLPQDYLPEILGLAIIMWLLIELWRRRRFWKFIRYGRFSD